MSYAVINGDRLTGKVLDLGKGRLRLETAHSGVVSIDWAQIVSVKTEGKVRVKLAPGAAGRIQIQSENAAARWRSSSAR